MKIEVKICGITRREDAEFATRCGADYLGFVFAPSSPRRVLPAALPALAAGLPVRKVGVFVDADIDFIRAMTELGQLDIVQLHGSEPPDFARAIPFAEVWKASYDPDYPAARLVCDAPRGGSGQFGDHRKAAELAKLRPVMLAGGVTPENVTALAVAVRPRGIDVASGVEAAPGVKDHQKLIKLFNALKGIA